MKPAMPQPPSRAPRQNGPARRADPVPRLLGSLDRVEADGTLEGWCLAPATPQQHRTIAVTIDGHVVARAVCDRPRAEAAAGEAAAHGFLVRLAPGLLKSGVAVEVAVRDVATGQLVGEPVRVSWGAPAAAPGAARTRPERAGARAVARAARPALSGNLDRVTRDGWVSGWCWDPHSPGRKVSLDVLVDGAVVGATEASTWRADLQQAGIGDGRHGFAFALPYDVLAQKGTLRITVQESGGGGRTLGDPVTLRIGRLAESEQRVAALEQQVRLLRGKLDAMERQAADQPEAEERAARALFGTVAAFFRELADGAPEDARSFGPGRGVRATLDALAARLPALDLRAPARPPAVLVIVPATEPAEAVHRCLAAMRAADLDAAGELLLLDPGDADAQTALLPGLVRGLRYERCAPAGLVAACNQAIERSAAGLVAIVDPMVAVTADWLGAMQATFAAEPGAVLVGSQVLRADGLLQHGGFAIGRGALLRDPAQFAEADRSEHRVLRPVAAVAALACAADRARLVEHGGLDAGFRRLGHAVVALCAGLRAARPGGAGEPVLLQPAAAALWSGLEADPARTLPDLTGADEDARRLRLALLKAEADFRRRGRGRRRARAGGGRLGAAAGSRRRVGGGARADAGAAPARLAGYLRPGQRRPCGRAGSPRPGAARHRSGGAATASLGHAVSARPWGDAGSGAAGAPRQRDRAGSGGARTGAARQAGVRPCRSALPAGIA